MPIIIEDREYRPIEELAMIHDQILMTSIMTGVGIDAPARKVLNEIHERYENAQHIGRCYNMSRCHKGVPEEFMDDRVI